MCQVEATTPTVSLDTRMRSPVQGWRVRPIPAWAAAVPSSLQKSSSRSESIRTPPDSSGAPRQRMRSGAELRRLRVGWTGSHRRPSRRSAPFNSRSWSTFDAVCGWQCQTAASSFAVGRAVFQGWIPSRISSRRRFSKSEGRTGWWGSCSTRRRPATQDPAPGRVSIRPEIRSSRITACTVRVLESHRRASSRTEGSFREPASRRRDSRRDRRSE